MKALLSEHHIPFAYADISSSMAALKSFLVIRDTSPLYAEKRGTRSVGIPLLLIDGEPYLVDCPELAQAALSLLLEP